MGCLDEQTVVAFVGGGLTGEALAAVERHLLACADCTTLVALAAPMPGSPAPPPQAIPEPIPIVPDGAEAPLGLSSPPGPGSAVGRYRLLYLVGRGGMGEVYAAHDPELDRKVAIKILRADNYPDEVESARLLREAQSVAKLSHPNLVTVYDVGTAGGRLFLAMELIEARALAAWLDSQQRSRADRPGVRDGRPRAGGGQHVVRLEVAMHEAGGMGRRAPAPGLGEHHDDLGTRAVLALPATRAASAVRRSSIAMNVRPPSPTRRHGPRSGARASRAPGPRAGAGRDRPRRARVGAQQLDRDLAVSSGRQPRDHAHAAANRAVRSR